MKQLIGAVDGVNTTFATAVAYIGTTVRVWLNGSLQTGGFTEVPPLGVEMDTAPRTGDTLHADHQVT